MTIQRMEHVGIVVDDLAAAMAFFVELGLKLQGEGPVEGGWVDRVVGLEGVRAEIAMVETPDGHGRLELTKFHAPSGRGGDRHAPGNTPGPEAVARNSRPRLDVMRSREDESKAGSQTQAAANQVSGTHTGRRHVRGASSGAREAGRVRPVARRRARPASAVKRLSTHRLPRVTPVPTSVGRAVGSPGAALSGRGTGAG